MWWPQITYWHFVSLWPDWSIQRSNAPFSTYAATLTRQDLTLDSASFWWWKFCSMFQMFVCLLASKVDLVKHFFLNCYTTFVLQRLKNTVKSKMSPKKSKYAKVLINKVHQYLISFNFVLSASKRKQFTCPCLCHGIYGPSMQTAEILAAGLLMEGPWCRLQSFLNLACWELLSLEGKCQSFLLKNHQIKIECVFFFVSMKDWW